MVFPSIVVQGISIAEGCFGFARISVSWQLLVSTLPPAITFAQQSCERISRTLTLSAVRERSSIPLDIARRRCGGCI